MRPSPHFWFIFFFTLVLLALLAITYWSLVAGWSETTKDSTLISVMIIIFAIASTLCLVLIAIFGIVAMRRTESERVR